MRWGGVAAMSAAVLSGLSACEERPYPAPTHTPPPAAKPTADLMGAPTSPSPYTAPPVVQAPPPAAYAPPPAAYAPTPQYYASGSIVAMAPIPNPGAGGSTYYGDGGRHRVHARYEAANASPPAPIVSPYGEGHPAPGRHPTYAYVAPTPAPKAPPAYVPPVSAPHVYAKATPAPKPVYAPKPTPPVYAAAPVPPKPVPTPAPKPTYMAKVEHKSAVVAAAAGVAAGHAAVEAKQAVKAGAADIKLAAKNAVATYKAAPPPVTPAPAPVVTGDRTTRLAGLQTALTDAIGKSAILTAPARFTANQPADVSLTIPATFAEALRSEAQKEGLSDAAASVTMTAILSGDGFAVTPDDTQSAPLTEGQPTEMHWTVTAQPGAKGPLHADIGADLLGGGSDKLSLGSVQKAAGLGVKLTPKVIGATLLVLIAALVVAWLARGRGPTRPAAARRASRRAARGGRPLDMSSDPAPVAEEPAH
jgi:hypothetical protein